MEKFIRYSIIFVSCWLVIVGCKTSKSAITTVNSDQTIKVSLYSIGAGIDRNAEAIVQNTISKYQQKGLDFTYVVNHWGREGEKDYCIQAQKLKAEDYKKLLNEIQTSLKDLQVHVYENHACTD
jgi:hypothetical protein